ncbi:membrane protein : Putative membrane protein OS=Corynebacterium resistens (strain DSM 45100 / JCM 12819 / GTC 2026) GN=CRES_0727 PE=4 SV=1: DUF2029 [Gemmata massiliana]|uniref:DUF2029 domain-containing protein n=1 Tax=Gemmata massiliana TaxID=1210884 RepID=A0A6P2CVW7_9BACT|nr:membrane protein : Putative membrane protein OS=Corynebacterium resistens (strain DSM 45100 / JCM 12819 / GTC 2026) GN=CRES_0727 PE=4 SV=1: DUF2029 [Gemmata massiliana]
MGRWHAIAAVAPVFVVTRVAIFFAATSATDSQVYYQYGVAARVSSVGTLFREYDAEYPQLAVLFSAGVGLVADVLPAGAERVIAARPSFPADTGTARFQVALGLVLGAIDLGVLLLIAHLGRKLQPNDPRTQTWRLGLYVAGTAALGPILYDRLDLVVGAVALVSVIALVSSRPIVAYALLTAGVGFKLVPAVLLPLFVVAAAVQRAGRFWPAFAREIVIALVVFALWPGLSILFGGGDRAFVYMKYHAERGVELGSVYAAPLLAQDASVGYAFGGYVVRGAAADRVAKVAQILTIVGVGLSFLVAARALRRCGSADRVSVVVAGCVLTWLVFILTGKVGSPQYLLWVAPLVPLLPLRTRAERVRAVGFVGAGLLATLTYPYLWPAVHGAPVPNQPETWAGPTPLGFVLLLARWGAIVVLTGWLALRLWKFDHRAPFTDVPRTKCGGHP